MCGGLAERVWDHTALFLWALRSCDSAFLFSAPSRDIVCARDARARTFTTGVPGSEHPHTEDVGFSLGSFSNTYVKLCCFTTAPSSYRKIQLTIPEPDLMCYLCSEILFLFKQVIWGVFLAQGIFATPERHMTEKKVAMVSNARCWAVHYFQNHLKEGPLVTDKIYDPHCFHTRLVSMCVVVLSLQYQGNTWEKLANELLFHSSDLPSVSLLYLKVNMEFTEYISITDHWKITM